MTQQYDIRQVPLEALLCRGHNNHHWELVVKLRSEAYTPQRSRRAPQFGKRWVSLCRCESERIDLCNEQGKYIEGTRRYDYSSGYDLAKEFTREECRVEMQRRATAINQRARDLGVSA